MGTTPHMRAMASRLRAAPVAVAVSAVVVAAAACGGSGSQASPASGPAPGSNGHPTRSELARRAFTGYLGAVRAADAAASAATTSAVAQLRGVARDPSAARIARAARGVRTSAEALQGIAATLAAVHPRRMPPRTHERLRRSIGRTAAGLRMVARGLEGWPFGGAAAGRRTLRRAADAALAWEGDMRRIALRRGLLLPGWVTAQTRRAQALAHAVDVVFTPVRLAVGVAGAPVKALQERLAALGYLPAGYAPGVYDYQTMQATMAFQGWEAIARDGVAGPLTLHALRTAVRPAPWSGDPRHMEVHKAQQVLLLVDGGRVVRAIHVSTAAPGHVTPDGTFTIYRKERMSWSVPFQVWMPYANYFTGGYALHEYPDVPPYPASHGCIRVPAGESVVVWDFASIGTPVTIG